MVGGPAVDRTRSEYGMIGTSRRTPTAGPVGQVGTGSADISYMLDRPRSELDRRGDQTVQARLAHWSSENGFRPRRTTVEIRGECAACATN